jgi:hypothetical protein
MRAVGHATGALSGGIRFAFPFAFTRKGKSGTRFLEKSPVAILSNQVEDYGRPRVLGERWIGRVQGVRYTFGSLPKHGAVAAQKSGWLLPVDKQTPEGSVSGVPWLTWLWLRPGGFRRT